MRHMKKIPLTQGLFAIVEDSDFESVDRFKWCAHRQARQTYAYRSVGQKTIFLHQFLMSGIPRVDHRDGNGLNNQRSNLRPATVSNNACNRGRPKNNTSGFKGVYWNKLAGKWHVKIQLDRKRKHIGYFDDPVEGAKAYDRAARELHGEFARPNFSLCASPS